MAKIIMPEEYTPAMLGCIEKIKIRLENTCTPYESNDLLVIESGEVVIVMANPVLGEEAIYDEFDQIIEHAPLRNITLVYADGRMDNMSEDFDLRIPVPLVRVLRPELCMRIVGNKVVNGADLQHVVEEEKKTRVSLIVDSIMSRLKQDIGQHQCENSYRNG